MLFRFETAITLYLDELLDSRSSINYVVNSNFRRSLRGD